MRRPLAVLALAAVAALTFGGATAGATCGGGQPGEPCYCPEYPLFEKLGIGVNC